MKDFVCLSITDFKGNYLNENSVVLAWALTGHWSRRESCGQAHSPQTSKCMIMMPFQISGREGLFQNLCQKLD